MSRHSLTPKPDYRHHLIIVGWDRPLGTFFAHVHPQDHPTADRDDTDSASPVRMWLGDDESIGDPRTVIDAVRPYAEIPDHLYDTLKAEQASQDGMDRISDALYEAELANHGASIQAAVDQFLAAMAARDNDAMRSVLRTMLEGGLQVTVAHILTLLTMSSLDALGIERDPHRLYGMTIDYSGGTLMFLSTPDRAITVDCHVFPPAWVLVGLGYGPDRYQQHTLGTAYRVTLFGLDAT